MIVLDTETTGLGGDAEICEIAIINGNGEVLLDTLVKPTIPISMGAREIHGITDEMVAGAPHWAELHEQFTQLIKKQKVHIYNAQYDLRLLQQTAAVHGLRPGRCNASCVMLEFTRYSGGTKWHKLAAAARTCGVPVKEAHRALGDCRMTLGVLEYMNKNPRKRYRRT